MSKTFIDSATDLFWASGREKSARFAVNFSRNVRHFVLRLTGGCGLLSPEHAAGMKNLEDALAGRSANGTPQPRFSGFGLFGGTRMLRKDDPSVIVPGITEVFPNITSECPEAVFLGVAARTEKTKHSQPYGIIMSSEGNHDFFTILHPTMTAAIILQPGVDADALWDDEYKECIFYCDELRKAAWQNLLVVYNGGGIAEKEILAWAKLGKLDRSNWKVLLIKGSGRKADQYAGDESFLAEHPTVHVAGPDIESTREKLLELGALTWPK